MLTLILFFSILCGCRSEKDSTIDFGSSLVSSLRNDMYLDLPEDHEYEDLRAEALAYHTAFASLAKQPSRRSLGSTPCWQAGGICINRRLCIEPEYKFLTQVEGCKDKLNVCCFRWNEYNVHDFREQGYENHAYPWKIIAQQPFVGAGVKDIAKSSKKKRPRSKSSNAKSLKKKQEKRDKKEDRSQAVNDERKETREHFDVSSSSYEPDGTSNTLKKKQKKKGRDIVILYP